MSKPPRRDGEPLWEVSSACEGLGARVGGCDRARHEAAKALGAIRTSSAAAVVPPGEVTF